MTYLEQIIKNQGPILSSELLDILIERDSTMSREAARKRLSRVGNHIVRIKGLFSDGQILFHEKAIYGSEVYFEGLSKSLKKAGKQYYIILKSLDFHYGQLKLSDLPAYSVNPIFDLKGHITFHSALDKLVRLKLVQIDENFVWISSSISDNSSNYKKAKGVEVAKNFLLVQFNDWARKIGLVAYNSSKFQSEFGKYQFNFVSPSYIGSLPVNNGSKIIPAFIVADILIGNTVNESEIEFFINKVKALKFQKNLPKFIPFLIVESIDTKALNDLKAQGVVIGFVNELFGDKYKDLLNSLIGLVTNAGAILKKNPEAYLDLITKLNKMVEGKTNNLRGDLFELAVGYYQGRVCNSIDIGKLINHEGLSREIDVFGLLSNSVIIAECKGYNQKVNEEEVKIWLTEKVPIIRKWILNQASLSDKKLIFEFWSTGGFTTEAINYLSKKKTDTTKYVIEFYDLESMLNKSKEMKSNKFTEILRDYYIKEI